MDDVTPSEPQFGRRAAPAEDTVPSDPVPASGAREAAPAQGEAARAPAEQPSSRPVPRAAGAPRRSRQSRNQTVVFLNFLLSCVTVGVLAAGLVVWYGKRTFEAPGPGQADTAFAVEKGAGVRDIAEGLEGRGLITDARVFQAGVRVSVKKGALQAGEFAIPAHASMRDIMDIIASGKSIFYSLTIPEGLTVEQALARVAAQEELDGPMPATRPPEGSLATDTQRFNRGTPRVQIVDKMIAEQKALVDEIWAGRDPDLPLADTGEFVTLASIVEKETGVESERPRVAAVFVNRLNKNMRLQSDPTVIYGLFGGKGKPPGRDILQADLDKPTPYNTYKIRGLPPTPIANPGRAALEAVAHPADTKELYFVADGSGGHAFASTLAEHNANVARWRALQDSSGTADDANVEQQ